MGRSTVEDSFDEEETGQFSGDSGDDETVPCPSCGREIYAAAEQCPKCGDYVTHREKRARMPWWVVAGLAAALLTAVVLAVFPMHW